MKKVFCICSLFLIIGLICFGQANHRGAGRIVTVDGNGTNVTFLGVARLVSVANTGGTNTIYAMTDSVVTNLTAAISNNTAIAIPANFSFTFEHQIPNYNNVSVACVTGQTSTANIAYYK